MPGLEPTLLAVVADLERGLRTLGVPFAVVGALVRELLLDVRPVRMTNDADVTVTVESLADFEVQADASSSKETALSTWQASNRPCPARSPRRSTVASRCR